MKRDLLKMTVPLLALLAVGQTAWTQPQTLPAIPSAVPQTLPSETAPSQAAETFPALPPATTLPPVSPQTQPVLGAETQPHPTGFVLPPLPPGVVMPTLPIVPAPPPPSLAKPMRFRWNDPRILKLTGTAFALGLLLGLLGGMFLKGLLTKKKD